MIPELALSVRQPWAWAIIHAGKHLENRSWGSFNHALKRQRGPICIHASSGMTRHEYEDARDFMLKFGVTCPAPADLVRGGIIGTAVIVDWVRTSHSFWFMGPGALSLREMTPIDPIPCSGALGYFKWRESGELTAPAKWMVQYGSAEQKWDAKPDGQGRLL